LVDFAGGSAGGDLPGEFLENARRNGSGLAHELDLAGRFDRDTGSARHDV
jgi:hypothetical protein